MTGILALPSNPSLKNFKEGSFLKTIELRAFGKLMELFRKRNINLPAKIHIKEELTVRQLLHNLKVPESMVEVAFINGRVQSLEHPINPGDRVALVPPGLPGIHRFLMGFYSRGKQRPY